MSRLTLFLRYSSHEARLELTRVNSLIIVVEGFLVYQASHFLGGNLVAFVLLQKYPQMPPITAATIGSSDIPPLVAILYMSLRVGWYPNLKFGYCVLPGAVGGIVLAWLVSFGALLFFDKENTEAQEILSLPKPYLYHGLFSAIVWNPLLEEVISRGFFLEILRNQWNLVSSVIISTLLFAGSHWLWAGWSPGIALIACNSLVFTLAYVQGGVLAPQLPTCL